VIDAEEILLQLCGRPDVAAFKRVKAMQMRLADAARRIVADDLGGVLPESGKQFLETGHGRWRLAAKSNSDNSTEERERRRMGATPVLMFGDLSEYRRAHGWIGIDELYALHGVHFDLERIIRATADHLKEATEHPLGVTNDQRDAERVVVKSTQPTPTPQ
jgi:hypothetical protein